MNKFEKVLAWLSIISIILSLFFITAEEILFNIGIFLFSVIVFYSIFTFFRR